MKRRLNILCIVLMSILGVHFALQMVYIISEAIEGFKEGFEAGYKSAENRDHRKKGHETNLPETNYIFACLEVKDHASTPDSLFNKKTGEWIPARFERVEVKEQIQPNIYTTIINLPLVIILLGSFITALVCFFKLIGSVNNSAIFTWTNVYRLQYLSFSLIAFFIAYSIFHYMMFHDAKEYLQLANYNIIGKDFFNTTTLILGLISLLLAEIFSIGLKLKEKQDLTI